MAEEDITTTAEEGTGAQEPQSPEPEESSITIGEDGEVNVPDIFWEDLSSEPAKPEPTETKPATPEETPAPTYYTPEEFAAAFASGNIDEAKLRPDLAEFYRAAVKQPPAPPIQQPPAVPPVQATGVPAMTPQQYAHLREAAKQVAAKNFLGIDPADFDDMDPSHLEAQRFAMGQIQARAQEIASARAAVATRAQQLRSEIQSLDAEYWQKDPEFFKNHEALMRDYLGRMPFRAAAEAIGAINAGDAAGIRKFLAGVYADYKAASANKSERKSAAPPPPVMNAGGAPGSSSENGLVDAGELAGMTPDEQAAWLIKNKFAV